MTETKTVDSDVGSDTTRATTATWTSDGNDDGNDGAGENGDGGIGEGSRVGVPRRLVFKLRPNCRTQTRQLRRARSVCHFGKVPDCSLLTPPFPAPDSNRLLTPDRDFRPIYQSYQ